MRIIITAPDIFEGDAVGNHCFGMARLAERIGLSADLYAQHYDVLSQRVDKIDLVFDRARPEDFLVVSYSIFDPFLNRLLELPCQKICYFHGVTDPELLREFEPQTAKLCASAIKQFPKLNYFNRIVANSKYTAQVLTGYVDFEKIEIIPPVFADMPVFKWQPLPKRNLRSTYNLLVVGRVVPHKRIEDTIKILANIRCLGIDVSLTVVGAMPNHEYSEFLLNQSTLLDVFDYVIFKGMIDNAHLFECYENASVLISASRHEGFCVPVLEAMHFGLPVVVRSGTAASEIARGACIEYNELKHAVNYIFGILNNPVDYQKFVKAGKKRTKEILLTTEDSIFVDLLNLGQKNQNS